MQDIKKIYDSISYEFNDEKILFDAVTHTTKAKRKNLNFQRLEFLGDRILGLIIADILYKKFPNEPEGDLTRRMHHLVNDFSSNILMCLHPSLYLQDKSIF